MALKNATTRTALAIATTIALVGDAAGQADLAMLRTSRQARDQYLAHAIIWQGAPEFSPADLLAGPPAAFPYSYEQATSDDGVPCSFAQPGRELGGASPKFLSRPADGRNLRLKYWDPRTESGNREVFATVAASRLMWALGFNAVPALPLNLRCEGCPENPMSGSGGRGTRRYTATLQAAWPTPGIVSIDNADQGWSWRDLDAAIRSLPPGVERTAQRTYFDALTLLGVFMQHGDRKTEQQRLYCAAPLDSTAGVLRPGTDHGTTLLEASGAAACKVSAVMILDAGETFGGGGRLSRSATAAMNLQEWRAKSVFRDSSGTECRGDLTDSARAGSRGEPNPIISEQGRRFLLDQLQRLTPSHIRAIFMAARVEQLHAPRAPATRSSADVIDGWVAAFEGKVRQIELRRCEPFS